MASIASVSVAWPTSHAQSSWGHAHYRNMRDDSARTSAYYRAIDALAPGKVVLDLGTGALALLAIRCARAGAAHVYAVEAQPASARKARRAVEEAGLGGVITVIEGNSRDVKLPRRADLVVHEIVGELASCEGVAAALRHAAANHVEPKALRRGGWSVPRCVTTWIAPAELPPRAYMRKEELSYKVVSGARGRTEALPISLPHFPLQDCVLAEPQPVEQLQFGEATSGMLRRQSKMLKRQARSLRFGIQRPGTLAGFSLHVTLDCGGGAPLINSATEGSSWSSGFLPSAAAAAVGPGDVVEVAADIDLRPDDPLYRLRAALLRRRSAGRGGHEASQEPPTTLVDTAFDARWSGGHGKGEE